MELYNPKQAYEEAAKEVLKLTDEEVQFLNEKLVEGKKNFLTKQIDRIKFSRGQFTSPIPVVKRVLEDAGWDVESTITEVVVKLFD